MSTPEHGAGRDAHRVTIVAAGARTRDGLRVSDRAAAVRC
jgi:hypothetical protein